MKEEHMNYMQHEVDALKKIKKAKWVGLTDEEVHALSPFYIDPTTYDLIRAAEAKSKEKNYD